MSKPNPNITPIPETAPVSIRAGYEFSGQPAHINPGFLSTLLIAIAGCYSQLNALLIQENVPAFLFTLKYFLSIAAEDGSAVDSAGHPVGSLYVLVAQDGVSAYTPPAPPVALLKAVFGLAQNNGNPILFGDGTSHLVWTMGAGTTYQKGSVFVAGVGDPSSSVMNPDGPLPPFGTYQVIQWGMGQAITSV